MLLYLIIILLISCLVFVSGKSFLYFSFLLFPFFVKNMRKGKGRSLLWGWNSRFWFTNRIDSRIQVWEGEIATNGNVARCSETEKTPPQNTVGNYNKSCTWWPTDERRFSPSILSHTYIYNTLLHHHPPKKLKIK